MKNKLFVVSALCAATLFSAQIDLRNTRFGITGGGTYSRVSNAHNPSGPIYSGFGGVLALIPVDKTISFISSRELNIWEPAKQEKIKMQKVQ